MNIQLSDHFNYKRLIKFVVPSILMMICTSIYSIVDGFFVSNFVGKTSFAAVNLIMPVLMAVGTIGFMIGTGGSALVSKTLGEGDSEKANKYFSLLIYSSFVFGSIISIIGFIFTPELASFLGAKGKLLEDSVIYARILFFATPIFILQSVFQSFFIVAEKPNLSLKVNIIAGILNVLLDYLFIAVFDLGIVGAALATTIGQLFGGLFPIFYFMRKNNSTLKIIKTEFNLKVLTKTVANGSSEMITGISSQTINILYNYQLMKIAGEDGIAAYGVIMYVNILFMSIFIGYSIGSAPVISYHYGSGNKYELKNLFRKSLILMILSGIALTLLAEILAVPLVKIFVSYDIDLLNMTIRGFMIYSLAFIIMGINVWGSAFFTALNNGVVSAIISFLRTFVFQIIIILILPIIMGIDGIWLSIGVAELLAIVVTILFFIKNKKSISN